MRDLDSHHDGLILMLGGHHVGKRGAQVLSL